MTMLDEIREQPEVLRQIVAGNTAPAALAHAIMGRTTHGLIAARGTSDNAGRYAQYLWGSINNYTVGLTTPSLFSLYHDPPRIQDAMVVGISQSGQSPDIVSVLGSARRQGQPTVAITNDTSSPLAGEADIVLDIRAGAELAVAATKTYTGELANVALISTGGERGELDPLPDAVGSVIEIESSIEEAARAFVDIEQCAVIARGHNHATAFEWALKLQELTYTVAQPFSTADFLHGPIAVIEPGYPVLAVAMSGPTLSDVVEVIERSVAAGARVVTISDDPATAAIGECGIVLPDAVPEWLSPIPAIVAAQLFSYHLTLAKGLDPESPRGLRKVTRTT